MINNSVSPTTVTLAELIAWNQKAQYLSLQALRIKALQGGQYISRFKGRGMEFEEVRPYQAGDDIRSIDWRVTARTQKVHTKLFKEEKERPILFCLDLCHNLFFGSRQAYKSVIGAHILALLAWAASHHRDRVGGMIFSEAQHVLSTPKLRQKGVLALIRQVVHHSAWQRDHLDSTVTDDAYSAQAEGAFFNALLNMRKMARPGSLVFIISDWYHTTDRILSQIQQIAKHTDMVMIFLYDILESDLPIDGIYPILWHNQFHFLNTNALSYRSAYQKAFQDRIDKLQVLCRHFSIKFVPCATHLNIFDLLNSHFNKS